MGDFGAALAALAELEVEGVRVHYAIGESPAQVDSAALPALLILPTERGGRRLGVQGDGFSMVTFGETGATYSVEVTHLLLVCPEAWGISTWAALPTLAGLIDGYFTALRADVLLGGALKYPPNVEVSMGVWPYGAGTYVAAAFRHVWTVGVGGGE